MRKVPKLILSLFIFTSMMLSITSIAWAKASDVKGHWAETQINSWIDKGLVKGYSDGTFKPDNPISRAEFCALVNRSFGFAKKTNNIFKDVSSKDWFSDDISKAIAQGYLTGFPDKTAGPNKNITRQEVVTILARILKLKTNDQAVSKFLDDSKVAAWAKGSVAAVSELGYINTYADNTFRPDKNAVRAEAVYILAKAVGELYNTAGVFGPETGTNEVSGNAMISRSDIRLRNTVIKGNLYLSEAIGDGSITLENVKVLGSTTICGGGEHSVFNIGSSLGTLVNEPENGKTRLGTKAVAVVSPPSGGSTSGGDGNNGVPAPTPPTTPPPVPIPTSVTVVGVDVVPDVFVPLGTTIGAITLPTAVTLNLSNTSTSSALIASWDTSQYHSNANGTYVMLGTFVLPSGVTNPGDIRARANISVVVGIVPDLIADRNVVAGTAVSDIHLPASVPIHLENGSINSAGINWNVSALNPNVLGTYIISGTLVMPAGIQNPLHATVSMRVLVVQPVLDPRPNSPIITSTGTLIDEFDSLAPRITSTDGIMELDTRNVASGSASLNITSNIASGGGDFTMDDRINMNMSGLSNLQFAFYIPDLSQIEHVSVRVYTNDTNYYSRFIGTWQLVNGWNRITQARDDFQINGAPSWGNITRVSLVFFAQPGCKPSVNVDRIAYSFHARPKVLFTFDDGWYDLIDNSITDNAFSYMTSKGYKGTVWVKKSSSALQGNNHITENGSPAYMNENDLDMLYNAGWDIGNHTVNHPDNISTLSDDQILSEYQQNLEWIVSKHWTRGANFAAYPSGAYNDHTINLLRGIGVLAARTTAYGLQSVPVDNMYKLRCISLDAVGGVNLVKTEIDHAVQTGSTVIFMIHKVKNNGDPLAMTTQQFKDIVDYVDSQHGNIDVSTFSEWYNAYTGNTQPEVSVSDVDTIPDMSTAYGTTIGAIGLPTQVQVTLSDSRTASVGISWNNSTYSPTTTGVQNVTGTLVLPAGITNPAGRTARVRVTVGAQPTTTITSVGAIGDMSVPYGTTIGAIILPTQIQVTLSDSKTATLGVTWNTSAYSSTAAGIIQNFTGALTLTAGITNPAGRTARVRITVEAQPVTTITTVGAIADISVAFGTTIGAINLTTQAAVTLSSSMNQSLSVTWDTSPYNGNVPHTYVLTGTLTLPDGITNPLHLNALVNVIVRPAP